MGLDCPACLSTADRSPDFRLIIFSHRLQYNWPIFFTEKVPMGWEGLYSVFALSSILVWSSEIFSSTLICFFFFSFFETRFQRSISFSINGIISGEMLISEKSVPSKIERASNV